MKPSRDYRSGFTLVEILVTITIIATLAAASLAFASRAKTTALSASTLSNLREIGACSSLSSIGNNNLYPLEWDNTNGANRAYAQTFDPYMQDRRGPTHLGTGLDVQKGFVTIGSGIARHH